MPGVSRPFATLTNDPWPATISHPFFHGKGRRDGARNKAVTLKELPACADIFTHRAIIGPICRRESESL